MATHLSLAAKDIRRGLRISVLEGSVAAVHIQLTGGIFLSGLALYLHATHFEIGLLSAIPALLAPMGFLSAFLISCYGKRKQLTFLTAGIGRGLFYIPALILLLGGEMNMKSLLVIVGFFNALIVLTNNAWVSWMSDLVPRQRWGRYFGLRNTIVGIVGMAVSYGGAQLLDYFKNNGHAAEGFGWVFLTAGLASTAAAILLGVQSHPPRVPQPFQLHETITVPLKDKRFRRLLTFLAFWFLTSGIASPFYGVHMLGNLGMPYSLAVLYGVFAGVLALLFQLVWGKVIDRMHPKPVLAINFIGIAFLPLMWLFATPKFLLPIWIDAAFTGVFWTGVNAALFNIMLGSISENRLKESYLALFTTVTGLGSFISALLGGAIAEALAGFKLELFGMSFINYHVLFLTASLFRFLALPLLIRLEGPKAPNVKLILAAMGGYTLRRLTPAKGLRLRSFFLWTKRSDNRTSSSDHNT